MADTPQQPDAAVAAGAGGGEAAAAPKAKGGLASYLPLIIVIVLMPVAAWVTLTIKAKMEKAPADEPKEEESGQAASKEEVQEKPASSSAHGGSASSGAHGGGSSKGARASRNRDPELPVPLTREIVAWQPARAADPSKPDDVEKIVSLDSKGEPKDVAQADKIVVNVARSNGRAYAVGRFSLKGPGEKFVQQVNLNRERLLDVVTGTLSSKTLEEFETPGFKNLLRAELMALFNQVLGGNAVTEVVITELVTQQ
jgi:flagellar basal body-associated protein FliL